MRKLWIVLVLVLTLVCACSRQEEKTDSSEESFTSQESSSEETEIIAREYTPNTLRLHEINDFSYILPDGEMTEENGNIYVFEKTIPEEIRNSFIQSQQQLLSILNITEPYTFFLSESYMDRSDEENKTAFFLTSSIQTWKQVLTTIQLVEGDDMNYGYAYAYANQLTSDLEWEADAFETVPEEEWEKVLQDDPERMNLVYPCFIEPYSTQRQIDLAKTISLYVYEKVEGERTEDAFITQAETIAKGLGLPFTVSYLRYANGGKSVPLIIRTKYVEEWITQSFETDATAVVFPSIPDSVNWQKNMTELIRIRELTDQTIEYARELIGFSESERKPVIYYQYKVGMVYSGYTSYSTDSIEASTPYVIAHEYMHYIHRHSVSDFRYMSSVYGETLACYFSRNMAAEEQWVITLAIGEEEIPRSDISDLLTEYYLQKIVDLDMSPAECLLSNQIEGFYVRYYLFGQYLVETYGEEIFFQLMFHPDQAMELVGETMDEIISDWDAYTVALIAQQSWE